MPRSEEELLSLPGIGPYTAGAIASIAFNRPVPAVDGNVLRVVSRIRMDERFITDAKVITAVEQDLLKIIPAERPGDFNQALMDLGASLCCPGTPDCDKCPLKSLCDACREGDQDSLPVHEKKQAPKA